eukprot:m51a1_g11558 hypothetical protein (474) ;mRNA; f:9195-10616
MKSKYEKTGEDNKKKQPRHDAQPAKAVDKGKDAKQLQKGQPAHAKSKDEGRATAPRKVEKKAEKEKERAAASDPETEEDEDAKPQSEYDTTSDDHAGFVTCARRQENGQCTCAPAPDMPKPSREFKVTGDVLQVSATCVELHAVVAAAGGTGVVTQFPLAVVQLDAGPMVRTSHLAQLLGYKDSTVAVGEARINVVLAVDGQRMTKQQQANEAKNRRATLSAMATAMTPEGLAAAASFPEKERYAGPQGLWYGGYDKCKEIVERCQRTSGDDWHERVWKWLSGHVFGVAACSAIATCAPQARYEEAVRSALQRPGRHEYCHEERVCNDQGKYAFRLDFAVDGVVAECNEDDHPKTRDQLYYTLKQALPTLPTTGDQRAACVYMFATNSPTTQTVSRVVHDMTLLVELGPSAPYERLWGVTVELKSRDAQLEDAVFVVRGAGCAAALELKLSDGDSLSVGGLSDMLAEKEKNKK